MQDSDNNYGMGIYTSEEHDVLVYSIAKQSRTDLVILPDGI